MKALYDEIGIGYKNLRQPDPRIATVIENALGDAVSIINVGAGAGSYEPRHAEVVAVEPSIAMIRQRPLTAAPVVQATAEHLPFADDSYDAALAILTVHHWPDRRKGIAELTRVAREKVVILTFDPAETCKFWLVQDYFPEIAEIDYDSLPDIDAIVNEFARATVSSIPIPSDCRDGFLGAYWQRPHVYLEKPVRDAISVFSKLADVETGLERLQNDIVSGVWLQKYGYLGGMKTLDVGYRLILAELN